MIRRLCLVVLAGLLLSGCTGEVTSYYPLKVGNLWTFDTTDLASGTKQTQHELIVRRVQNTYSFEHGETIINVGGKALVNKNGYTLLKTPFQKGVAWNEPGAVVEITAQGEAYRVPSGEFTDTLEVTMRIDRLDEKNPEEHFTDITVSRYARDVGPIYYHYRVVRPDGATIPVFQSELSAFANIKKRQPKSN